MRTPIALSLSALLATTACMADVGADQTAEAESSSADDDAPQIAPTNLLVQAGAHLVLMGVTDDNQAIYQDGQILYATALHAGATREQIADVPAGNQAFVYVSGKVAFCWTNPDRTLPGFGVSPLVIWSAATGANFASSDSPIGTVVTAASARGDLVVFPTHSNADGTVGDLEVAATDLSERTTLVAGAQMGFPAGACRPAATFAGRHRPELVATYCPGTATTATLSTWRGGERHNLRTDLATPPALSVDGERRRIFTILAGSRNPIVVTSDGDTTVLENIQSRLGWFNADGSVLYSAGVAPDTQLRQGWVRRPAAARKVVDLAGVLASTFGSSPFTASLSSPDGRWVSYLTALDPSGFSDVRLAKIDGDEAPIALETAIPAGIFGQPFTTNSSHALYVPVTDLTNFVGPMFAFDLARHHHASRQFSDDKGWSWAAAVGSIVSYNDNTAPTNLTADLRAVDVSARTLRPILIAAQADVTYLPSHRKTGVVYTTNHDPAAAGLYVARVF